MPNSHFLGRKSYILKLNVVGYAHAVNMDTHDLSLEELKALNRQRSKARKEHFNYDALLALGKRKELVEERKQDKKEKSSSKRLFSQILKDINHAAPTGKRQDLRPRLAGSLELFGLEIVIIDIDNAENLQKEAHFLLDKS